MNIKSQVENSKWFVQKTKKNWCGDEKKKGETIDDTNMKVDMNNVTCFKDYSFAFAYKEGCYHYVHI